MTRNVLLSQVALPRGILNICSKKLCLLTARFHSQKLHDIPTGIINKAAANSCY